MSHKLWVFPGGAAPRRAIIYLSERGLPSDLVKILPTTILGPGAPAEAPGKPPGSVPLLALPSGQLIHESLAIISYLEDLADAQGLESMRGRTPEERARVHDMLGLAEQVTISIELAAVHGCVMFAGEVEGQQSVASVRWLMRYCDKQLKRIAEYADKEGPWLVRLTDGEEVEEGGRITIADCVLFATLQYGREMFGLDVTRGHERIRVFYEAFGRRASAFVSEAVWPEGLREMARNWIDH